MSWDHEATRSSGFLVRMSQRCTTRALTIVGLHSGLKVPGIHAFNL